MRELVRDDNTTTDVNAEGFKSRDRHLTGRDVGKSFHGFRIDHHLRTLGR